MAEGKKAYMAVTVHDDDQQPHTFQVGERVPDWAVAKITNPHIFVKPKSDDDDEDDSNKSSTSGLTEPPKVGKGSATGDWAAYAEQLGLAVPAGAKKADIIELVEASKASQE